MRLLLAAPLLVLWLAASAWADDRDYGPDWQVCIYAVPSELPDRLEACNRMISGGNLPTPDLARAFSNRGKVYHLLGARQKAFEDYSRAQLLDPKRVKPYFNLGMLYQEDGHYVEALEQFDKALALDPRLEDLQCRRGVVLKELHRFDEATAAFEQAVQIFPAEACSIGYLIEIYAFADRFSDALAMVDRAIRANGQGTAQLYGFRAQVHEKMRQFELALEDLNRAVTLDPNYYNTVRTRGRMLTKLKRYDEALVDLNRAVALAPEFNDAYQWRGDLELRNGAYHQAFDDFRRCLSLQRDNSVCKVLGMQAAFLTGDFAAAAQLADSLPPKFFGNAPLHSGLAKFARGDLAAAEAAVKTYTKMMPDDPYGWLWLTIIQRRLGKDAPPELKDIAMRHDVWPMPILRHMLGSASAETVLAAADVPDADIRKQRTAEANYYLGELAAMAGDEVKSKVYMKESVAIGYAEIDPLNFIPVHKDNDAVEVGLAAATLRGGL